MSQELEILGFSALITAGIQLGGFAAAYALQTEKFYDILGGLNYLIIGLYSAIDGEYKGVSWLDDKRKIACTVIFFASRGWLLMFLAWRAHERGGDSRFDEVKDKFGMFLVYWVFQGLWVFAISMPVIFVNGSDLYSELSVFDFIYIIGFLLGVLIEIVADIQKAAWVKKGRIGHFCQVGIWKYSRHPNYFGEILQWWCAWGLSFSSGTGFGDVQWWFGIISPLFTMQILLNTEATGVANANGKNLKRYYDRCQEDYTEYRESTSILIPMIGYKYIPLFLKRTIFFDFKRYEYVPPLQGEA